MKTITTLGAVLFLSVSTTMAAHAADAQAGREAFVKNGCWSCHGYEGQGGASGPKLAPNPPALAGFRIFVRTNQTSMPAYSEKVLPDSVIDDMHAFLTSIKAQDPKSIPLLNND